MKGRPAALSCPRWGRVNGCGQAHSSSGGRGEHKRKIKSLEKRRRCPAESVYRYIILVTEDEMAADGHRKPARRKDFLTCRCELIRRFPATSSRCSRKLQRLARRARGEM